VVTVIIEKLFALVGQLDMQAISRLIRLKETEHSHIKDAERFYFELGFFEHCLGFVFYSAYRGNDDLL